METNGGSNKTVVKRSIISSSKLQPVKFQQAFVNKSQVPITSLENKFAAISFSQKSSNNVKANSNKKFELDLPNRHFSINRDSDDSPSQRFNPFDRSDGSRTSSSSSEDNRSSSANGLAELGLTEDHFSGSMGLSSAEELKIAIENCRELILGFPDESKKKEKLKKNLVELQIRLQELKETSISSENNIKIVLGHQLKKKKNRTLKAICDCCKSSIWSLIPDNFCSFVCKDCLTTEVWYECSECSFICHEKCTGNIRRSCVARIAKLSNYDLNICPESGLSKQMYCCRECQNPIAVNTGADKGHLCDYTGFYYCANCHWEDTMVIPARVVHNWDHNPQKVCRQSFQLLNKMFRLPVLNIEKINPMLFNYVEELSEIKRMRENILKMKEYIRTCKAAKEARLFHMLSNRQHFIENSSMYSMEDLMQTHSGQLTEELVKIHGVYAKHIKLDCPACQGKGFICEICNAGEALFPFDYMVSICSKCSAVFHNDCFSFIDKTCPRCRRKQEWRNLSVSTKSDDVNLTSSEDEDPDHFRNRSASPPYHNGDPIKPKGFERNNVVSTYPSMYRDGTRDKMYSHVSSTKRNNSKLWSSSLTNDNAKRLDHDRSDASNRETNDLKNPFETDIDTPDNPFLNDIYDQSKNPFCFQ